MNDESLPNGPWTGFYTSSPQGKRHPMNMNLHFSIDLVDGDGTDEIGRFQIHGEHNSKEVSWTKFYIGRHTVRYRGFRDGLKRALWGSWQISPKITGEFHIWPVGSRDDIEEIKIGRASCWERG